MEEYPLISKYNPILESILNFSQNKNVKIFIVGGFLRDLLLKRRSPSVDIDFAIKKNAIAFARRLAKKLRAGFVVLDKDNGCARLVLKDRRGIYALDFTDLRGKDLLEDLGRRDFSINSFAIGLKDFLIVSKSKRGFKFNSIKDYLQDPYGGYKDLESKVIRIINLAVFDDDPLRILRAFSLSSLLNFGITAKTLKLIKKKKNKLKMVSSERIRDELFKILSSKRGHQFLCSLDRYKILELIIPEVKELYQIDQGRHHHLDVWKHTLETVNQLEKILDSSNQRQEITDYLNEDVSSGRHRYELLKLAALMHDIGKPRTLRVEKGKVSFHGHERVGVEMLKELAKKLKLSNNEMSLLKRLVRFHLRPGYLANNPILTPRAKFRFFRDVSNEAIGVLLISLADQRATRGILATRKSRQRHERLIRRLINDYLKKKREKKIKSLINGYDIMKKFNLEPSFLIGRVLSEVQEERAIGKIRTKKEALRLARTIINKEKGE